MGDEVKTQKALFAAGCFWGVEEFFRVTEGVIDTEAGYAGGNTERPTYEQVCSGKTGHAEAVHIVYDPTLVSYEALLKIFWENHDPTTKDRQGPDVGTQYRSVIFYYTSEQQDAARASLKMIQKKYKEPIVTEIVPATNFWPAEEYHQQYLAKRGIKVCH